MVRIYFLVRHLSCTHTLRNQLLLYRLPSPLILFVRVCLRFMGSISLFDWTLPCRGVARVSPLTQPDCDCGPRSSTDAAGRAILSFRQADRQRWHDKRGMSLRRLWRGLDLM